MLEATARVVPRIDGTLEDAAAQGVERDLHALFAMSGAFATDFEALRGPTNELLRKAFADIVWWGSLDELRAGTSPFAREIVLAFRDEDDEDGGAGTTSVLPIADDELDDFVEFLATYGV
jgi:hypothetical protein